MDPGAFGLVRVAAAVPRLALGDPLANARRSAELLGRAREVGAAVVAFPEMGLTGYTCHDLFHQPTLLRAASAALAEFARLTAEFEGLAVVGLPVLIDSQVFNCAAVVSAGRVLGLVPKSYLPNYKEFYDARYFAPASQARSDEVQLSDLGTVPFGTDLLFDAAGVDGLTVGIEICEDLWAIVPPSSHQAAAGATVLLNLSASNELVGKAAYRRQLVANQSARCLAAYVYAGAGVGESSTDLVFGGHCLVGEAGSILAESPRFAREATLLVADVDIDRLRIDRATITSYGQSAHYPVGGRPFRRIGFRPRITLPTKLERAIDPHPFVPRADAELRERCDEVFQIQTAGLARRLEQIGRPPVAIGVSGGLDSTLALLVTCKTFDLLGVGRDRIQALTMPGFGTSGRTRANAIALMRQLGVAAREVDIRPLCMDEYRALGHAPFGIPLGSLDVDGLTARLRDVPPDRRHDLVFENVQARARTQLLMNTGFTIGTGDVSELALGWCTYNADHMSMYNVNVSVPKTLVKFLVGWVADNQFDGDTRATLHDIVGTEISPELLPAGPDGKLQSTESAVGPYELHDFFLFHFLRYGAPPAKILYLASQAKFDRAYEPGEIRKWLTVFLRRFFASQYKRSCLPDGPKVGSVSLSPRGDWRMPSDAAVEAWLADLG
ncbi:MAG: NAD(+) synthase [Gemmataceae bacterium]|nr:NAD(+) synthase [Gemmataceae bacterium]